jgi:phospholipid/cholesterol/gamma-HCH transport system permease protein
VTEPQTVEEEDAALAAAPWPQRFLFERLQNAGEVFLLIGSALRELPAGIGKFGLVINQMAAIGLGSMPLTVIVALFTGAVAAVQAAYQMRDYVPMIYLGTVIGKSVVIELGPVLTALVVGGRVSAAIAAELGSMRVTEQIDAMETLGISPVRYLVVPRLIASVVMLPVLTIFADILAIFGGYLVATLTLDVSGHTFTSGLKMYFKVQDVFSGLLVGLLRRDHRDDGVLLRAPHRGGAEAVGDSTTRAVVASCLLILIVDYLLASFLFRVLLPTSRSNSRESGSDSGRKLCSGVSIYPFRGESAWSSSGGAGPASRSSSSTWSGSSNRTGGPCG